MSTTAAAQVLRYHEETKHSPQRAARGPGALDWANQPNPFRIYDGITPVLLPLLKKDPAGSHLDCYERASNYFWDLSEESVAGFLELSLGLSAWKSRSDERWALRISPSSGNLHPTECHLIVPSIGSISGGVYHYLPYTHALEPRAVVSPELWSRLSNHFLSMSVYGARPAAFNAERGLAEGFFVTLSSIFWREAWKYGERSLRYCALDIGHALASLSIAANLFGWKLTYLNAVSDLEVSSLLGFHKTPWTSGEEELPEALCFVAPSSRGAIPRGMPADITRQFAQLAFAGIPKALSSNRVDWPLIASTLVAAQKPRTEERSFRFPPMPEFRRTPDFEKPAAELIRQRRSATALDGLTNITRAQLLSMLDKTLPRNGVAPFDLELGQPQITLFLYLHRVVDLEPGLYCYLRDPQELDALKKHSRPEFAWQLVEEGCPFYRLHSENNQEAIALASCGQAIAADGAFAVSLVARYRRAVEFEAWRYRLLHWEAGIIGQVLYLEAEAFGLRGTGIGCFFDDVVHAQLGFKSDAFQTLYHFTVGGPRDDHRLTTTPPYAHLPLDRRAHS